MAREIVQAQTPLAAGSIVAPRRALVYTKAAWADDWTSHPHLRCRSLRDALEPTVSTAELLFQFGTILRQGAAAFATELPLNLANRFVQIREVGDEGITVRWTGWIPDVTYQFQYASGVLRGDEGIVAYGLTHLLDRRPIRTAYVVEGGVDWCIDRVPTINDELQGATLTAGNRSTAQVDGVYLFSSDGEPWTAKDVIEYVLAKHAPEGLTLELTGPDDVLDALDAIEPRIRMDGLTVRQVLNALIARQRGLGWKLNTTGSGTIDVAVFSLLGSATGDLPANTDEARVDLSESLLFPAPQVSIRRAQRADRIRIRGERIKVCCTLNVGDGGLEKAWTDAEETAYLAATNDERTKPRFDRVFSYFRVPPGWDWTVIDGQTAEVYGVTPRIDADGSAYAEGRGETDDRGWVAFNRFLPRLPLLEGIDYTGATLVNRNPDGAVPGFLEPLVFLVDEGVSPQSFVIVNRLDRERFGNNGPPQIAMSDRELALRVAFDERHRLAYGHWPGTPEDVSDADPTDPANAFDWEWLYATVCIETDRRLSVYADAPEDLRTGDGSEIVIDVPGAELWYVIPGTWIGVNDEGLYQTVHPVHCGELRSDAAFLRQVLGIAQAWYLRDRASMQIPVSCLQDLARPGQLLIDVEAAWSEDLFRGVVTQVAIDYVQQKMTISAGYDELDVAAAAAMSFSTPDLQDERALRKRLNALERDLRDALRELRDPGDRVAPALKVGPWRGKIVSYDGVTETYTVLLYLNTAGMAGGSDVTRTVTGCLPWGVHASDKGSIPADAPCEVFLRQGAYYLRPETWP